MGRLSEVNNHLEIDGDGYDVFIPGSLTKKQRDDLIDKNEPDDGNRSTLFESDKPVLPSGLKAKSVPIDSLPNNDAVVLRREVLDLIPEEFHDDH